MNKKSDSPKARIQSFSYAIRGVIALIRQEPNARIHTIATIVVIIAGFINQLSTHEWIAIAFAIGIVWIAEALNTTVEMLCDLYTNGAYNTKVKVIKDIAAAAVLISSLTSITIGLLIFLN
ncbi:MAG: diacylglycerol kinase family protein [Flavipsychrobacter sp.]